MRPFGLRAEVAKQLFAAGTGALKGENPLRRLRKVLRLLSVPRPTGARQDADVLDAGFRALRLPALAEAPGPACLFVAYAPDGRFFAHTLRYCADLRRQGLRLVLIAVTDRPDLDCVDPGPEVADALLVRENHGYDFAAWASALRHMPELWGAPELWFANDSVYHALPSLAATIGRARVSAADVVAMTGSGEIAPHFQSYLFVLKEPALRRDAARRFWGEIRALADKNEVIRTYEVGQKAALEAGGLKVETLFSVPGGEGDNHLHQDWRALLAAGFPFVKVELLRDNPYGADLAGWRETLATHDFNLPDIAFHLGARPDGAAALLELR